MPNELHRLARVLLRQPRLDDLVRHPALARRDVRNLIEDHRVDDREKLLGLGGGLLVASLRESLGPVVPRPELARVVDVRRPELALVLAPAGAEEGPEVGLPASVLDVRGRQAMVLAVQELGERHHVARTAPVARLPLRLLLKRLDEGRGPAGKGVEEAQGAVVLLREPHQRDVERGRAVGGGPVDEGLVKLLPLERAELEVLVRDGVQELLNPKTQGRGPGKGAGVIAPNNPHRARLGRGRGHRELAHDHLAVRADGALDDLGEAGELADDRVLLPVELRVRVDGDRAKHVGRILVVVPPVDDERVGGVDRRQGAATSAEEEQVGRHRLRPGKQSGGEPVRGGQMVRTQHRGAETKVVGGLPGQEAHGDQVDAEPSGHEKVQAPAKEVGVGLLVGAVARVAVSAIWILRLGGAPRPVGRVADHEPQPP